MDIEKKIDSYLTSNSNDISKGIVNEGLFFAITKKLEKVFSDKNIRKLEKIKPKEKKIRELAKRARFHKTQFIQLMKIVSDEMHSLQDIITDELGGEDNKYNTMVIDKKQEKDMEIMVDLEDELS